MKNSFTPQQTIEYAVKTNEALYALGFEDVDAFEFIKIKRNELRLKGLAYETIQSKINTISKSER